MLVLENIRVHYGKVEALKNVSIYVKRGEIVSIIGGNGAGKTTLLKTITGLVKPTSGRVLLDDNIISGGKPHQIAKRGIVMAPEGRGIFPELSVEDNMLIGAYSRYFKTKRSVIRQEIEQEIKRFPILETRRTQLAGTLSGGEQQMLAFARCLMAKPDILLLDEPSMGLSPMMIKETFSFISELKAQKVTIILVEQMASHALAISDRAYVLEVGHLVLEGTGQELIGNPEVKKAYLGK